MVAFAPDKPQKLAGMRIDPPPSPLSDYGPSLGDFLDVLCAFGMYRPPPGRNSRAERPTPFVGQS
jgi:hypothetical protein